MTFSQSREITRESVTSAFGPAQVFLELTHLGVKSSSLHTFTPSAKTVIPLLHTRQGGKYSPAYLLV